MHTARESKKCCECGEVKDLEDGFHRHSASPDGRTRECRTCRNAKAKAWREANPHYARKWIEDNREYVSQCQKAYREKRTQGKLTAMRRAEAEREVIIQQQKEQGITPKLECVLLENVTVGI